MDKRRIEENELDYHKRIIYGKLVDKTVDDDYAELAELAYGERSSSDHCRKMMYGSRYTLELVDRYLEGLIEENSDAEILSKIELANISLKKERVRTQEQRAAYQRLIREQAKHETTKDIIKSTMQELDLPRLIFTRVPKEAIDTTMLVSLSDLHIGATIDNSWNKYDVDIAAERLEDYFAEIVKINSKEKCKDVTVYANGDIVSGIIHPNLVISSKENLIQQVMIASELISQFLTALSSEFEEVNFCSVPGNHSRLSTKLDSPLSERADDLVEFYLKARLQGLDNIHFDKGEKIDSTIHLINIRGKEMAVVHGDMDSESKAEALQKFCGTELYAILTGHMHHLRISDTRGIKIVQSGSLMGCDDFTVEKRIYGRPTQLITICNDDGFECFYNVEFK